MKHTGLNHYEFKVWISILVGNKLTSELWQFNKLTSELRPFIPLDDPCIPIELRGQTQMMGFPSNCHVPELCGKEKGMKVVLQETGLWEHRENKAMELGQPLLLAKCSVCKALAASQYPKTWSLWHIQQYADHWFFVSEEKCGVRTESDTKISDCLWFRILNLQSYFLNEKPLLQMVIEEAGHVCLFLKKFHCDLNPIELFWSYTKDCQCSA